MEAQKEGKKNTNMSSKSTVQDAISHWQSALAQTKQVSKNKFVTIPSMTKITMKAKHRRKNNNNDLMSEPQLITYCT